MCCIYSLLLSPQIVVAFNTFFLFGSYLFFFSVCTLSLFFFFFSSRRRHTRYIGDWSSDVCSSDLLKSEGLVLLAVTAAIFHLFTHAFFKALLFLSAGSVMHAMGNVIDMRRFGGLRRILPTTHGTFLCGALALAGFPLLAGFWSKDEILAAALGASLEGHPNRWLYLTLF